MQRFQRIPEKQILRSFLFLCGAIFASAFAYYLLVLPNEGDGAFFGLSGQRLFVLIILALPAAFSVWASTTSKGQDVSLAGLEGVKENTHLLSGLQVAFGVISLGLLFLGTLPPEMFGTRVYVFERLQIAIIAFAIWSGLMFASLFAISARNSVNKATNQLILLIYGAYIAIRLRHILFIREMATSPDSIHYWGGDSLTHIFSESFWIGTRPFTLPLFNTFLRNDLNALGWFQSLFSIFAWGLLVYVLTSWIKSPSARFAAAILMLGLSLSSQLLIWDWVFLSESLSNSLMLVLAALLLLIMREWRWRLAGVLVFVAFLWVHTRDLNAWILLSIGTVLGAYAVISKQQRKMLLFSVAFLGIFLLNTYSVDRTTRWRISYINVLVLRVLPNESKLDDLQRIGLPVNDALLQWSGKVDYSETRDMWNDPELQDFWQWVNEHGRSGFAQLLIAQLPHSILEPFADINFPLETDFIWYKAAGFQPVLPGWLDVMTRLSLANIGFLSFVLIVVTVGLWQFWRTRSVLILFGLSLMLLSISHNVLAWQVDAITVSRHLVGASLQFRVGLIVLVVSAFDFMSKENGKINVEQTTQLT